MRRYRIIPFSVLIVLALVSIAHALRAEERGPGIWLEELDLTYMQQGWKTPQAGKTVSGHPLSLAGTVYERGVGTHARSEIIIDLKKAATRFRAVAGVDDVSLHKGSVVFEVYTDNVRKASSPVMRGQMEPFRFDVDLTGVQIMALVVTTNNDNGNNDHADWANAWIELASSEASRPEAIRLPDPEPDISFTGDGPHPAIHGPRVVGCGPGHPFLFKVPATGERPLRFKAKGLPKGLSIDSEAGIISGIVAFPGEYQVRLTASGPKGRANRKLKIVCGEHQLALTPPLGWNSWNIWAEKITANQVLEAAQALVDSGLADKGYQYLNIDDGWQGQRDTEGVLQPSARFGDMKALADGVHALGLKLGIYSSPGPETCANRIGSYGYEDLDAQTWARWGIDYLKYDFCYYSRIITLSVDTPVEEHKKPYRVMRASLDKVDRDIVYSLCQYGMGDVWTWGEEVGANLWRTTGDILDTWSSMTQIGFRQDIMAPYAGPGHWNDPDMLVVGRVGWGLGVRDSKLTRNEQVTHITLWSLLAAPMLLGCDLTQLDEFLIALLGNPEVLEVNQDPLGIQATRLWRDDDRQLEVWIRPLYDGTIAAGFFNRGYAASDITLNWSPLGIQGRQPVRDLWMHKDLGRHRDSITLSVTAHGAKLIRVGKIREK